MTGISIIIPTVADDPLNAKLLRDCITSFVQHKSSRIDYEFVVVPNAMTGFERNVNKGFELATKEFVMVTNDDIIIVGRGWDELVLEQFKDPKVGLVSGTGYANYDYHPDGLPSYWFVIIRKEVIKQVGLLDETFKNFSSDHDHAMRILKAGWKIKHINLPMIYHYTSSTTKRFGDEQEQLKIARELFEKKWGIRER